MKIFTKNIINKYNEKNEMNIKIKFKVRKLIRYEIIKIKYKTSLKLNLRRINLIRIYRDSSNKKWK